MDKNAPAAGKNTAAENTGNATDEGAAAATAPAAAAAAQPTNHERGMAAIRQADPSARALWAVSAPRDEPGKIAAVLVTFAGKRRIVILHSYPTGFDVYAETDKSKSLPDALASAFGDGEE